MKNKELIKEARCNKIMFALLVFIIMQFGLMIAQAQYDLVWYVAYSPILTVFAIAVFCNTILGLVFLCGLLRND